MPGSSSARDTGLGAAALIPVEGRLVILATEAGHAEFGPAEPDEVALWPHLEKVMGRVSAEAVLSGPGLFRLAHALARGRDRTPALRGAERRAPRLPRGARPRPGEALSLFARLLGRFAGDLALTFEASGGVFIAGGIAPKMVDILREGGFRRAFDAEGAARRLGAPGAGERDRPSGAGAAGLAPPSSRIPARFVFPFQGWSAPA